MWNQKHNYTALHLTLTCISPHSDTDCMVTLGVNWVYKCIKQVMTWCLNPCGSTVGVGIHCPQSFRVSRWEAGEGSWPHFCNRYKACLRGELASGWDTVNPSTCWSLCISVYQKKHGASPDTHQVNSRSSSDKDCSAQGIGLSKL